MIVRGCFLLESQQMHFQLQGCHRKGTYSDYFTSTTWTRMKASKKSVRSTVTAVFDIWQRARIPTQRIVAAERKLQKLIDEYFLLKKNRKTELDSCRMKEDVFKGDLLDLFGEQRCFRADEK